MSSKKLPRLAEVKKLVDRGASLSGTVEFQHLARLTGAVSAIRSLEVILTFGRSENRKPLIQVQIVGEAEMQCQRCLDSVFIDLNIKTDLIVVAHDDEGRSLSKVCEAIVIDEGPLELYSIVEEEILLSLPIVAMHSVKEVHPLSARNVDVNDESDEARQEIGQETGQETGKESIVNGSFDKIERRSDIGAENPFNVLKSLKIGVGQEQM